MFGTVLKKLYNYFIMDTTSLLPSTVIDQFYYCMDVVEAGPSTASFIRLPNGKRRRINSDESAMFTTWDNMRNTVSYHNISEMCRVIPRPLRAAVLLSMWRYMTEMKRTLNIMVSKDLVVNELTLHTGVTDVSNLIVDFLGVLSNMGDHPILSTCPTASGHSEAVWYVTCDVRLQGGLLMQVVDFVDATQNITATYSEYDFLDDESM